MKLLFTFAFVSLFFGEAVADIDRKYGLGSSKGNRSGKGKGSGEEDPEDCIPRDHREMRFKGKGKGKSSVSILCVVIYTRC